MTKRFLIIKQAHVEDSLKADSIRQDIESLSVLIRRAFPAAPIDTCAVTEDHEWLMHGRRMSPSTQLPEYAAVYVCMHSADTTYDTAHMAAKSHAVRTVCLYDATDMLFHHAERLAEVIALHGDVSAVRVKVPHQIHVDVESLNADFTPSEDIARKHMRNLFLPIHVMEGHSHDYLKGKDAYAHIETKRLANNLDEFARHIDDSRHTGRSVTFREHIKGPEAFFISIPNFRNERHYVSLAFVHKDVSGRPVWSVHHLSDADRKEVKDVITHVSGILFGNQVVVYCMTMHSKRGAFVQYTIPLLHFALRYPEFLQTAAKESGIPLTDLFLAL